MAIEKGKLIERLAESMMTWYTPEKSFYDYVNGLGLECLYRVGKALGRQDFCDWVRNRFELFFNEDGTIKDFDYEEFSMDQISPGKNFFNFYEETKDEKYKRNLDLFFKMLMNQPRTPSGGFWHKKIYPNQMWLDGLYMQGSFYIRYALAYGDIESCLKDLVYQFELIYTKTLKHNGLLIHAWDESKQMAWCDKETGLSKCVWARAMGWYVMALVDALDFIPVEERFADYRARLIKLAQSLVDPLLNYQDESGMWYQVVDRMGEENNYLESSATSMFVYFLAKMARKKYLPEEKAIIARRAAEKGYEGLIDLKVSEDEEGLHLNDICRGAGLGKYYPECPFRDGTYEYYTTREPRVTDNLQGFGPFMLAVLEIERPEVL